MEKELASCSIPFESQKRLSVYYKENLLEQKYIPDLICFGKIIVELKAIKEVSDEHKAQLLNYLKATGFKAGLLINFATLSRRRNSEDGVVKIGQNILRNETLHYCFLSVKFREFRG